MADFAGLQARIDALAVQATATEGTEASAATVINGFAVQVKQAVTDALAADNKADQTSIDAANAAIDAVTARFAASGKALGDAIAANPGPTPGPGPTPVP